MITYYLVKTIGIGTTVIVGKMIIAHVKDDDKQFYKAVKWLRYFSGGSILAVVARIIYIM